MTVPDVLDSVLATCRALAYGCTSNAPTSRRLGGVATLGRRFGLVKADYQ